MSYTLHWPNHSIDVWRDSKTIFDNTKVVYTSGIRHTSVAYAEKLGTLTPALSLQADVLFPNSLAATSDQSNSNEPCAVGCKGNQLDSEFPLELRTPTCVPLVQYPTPVNSKSSLEEQDICALPILNWELYLHNFRETTFGRTSFNHVTSDTSKCRKKREVLPKIRSKQDEKSTDSTNTVKKDPPKRTRDLVKELVSTDVNMDNLKDAITEMTTDIRKKKRERICKLPAPKFRRRNDVIPEATLRKYKNVPNVRVQGTWNFLYNQKGACEWTFDPSSKDARILFVANGSHLRAVRVEKSHPASMISYTVNSVWDEERSVQNETQPDSREFLNDAIFQITAHRSESFVAVRRGTTIDLYNTIDKPSYLSCIPIRGYSRTQYRGHSKNKVDDNLIFSAFDLNPYNPCEIVTLDQNFMIQHHDIVAEKSTPGVSAMDDDLFNVVPIATEDQFSLNKAAGLSFANDLSTMYFYYNSKVYFYDRRQRYKIDGVSQCPDFHSLFDLCNDQSSIALSDQHYFNSGTENKIQEYVSCVQRSHNPNYYYVGTSYRIFLMDWRVPKHPVIKLSHGMRSPAAYIDTNYNKKFEVVIAGSQRRPEIFSAVLDYAHVSCVDRPECTAKNPILSSYPRHLSNSMDFLEGAFNCGNQFAWESESRRVTGHCNAWCTGLSICTLPGSTKLNKPPGSGVISTNNFGDIFYQEWTPKPLECHRKNNRTDPKWTDFLDQWKDSMTVNFLGELQSPSKDKGSKTIFMDCTAIIEPNVAPVEELQKVNDTYFNPFEMKKSQYESIKANLKSVEENTQTLKKFKSTRAKELVEIWEKDWKCKTPSHECTADD